MGDCPLRPKKVEENANKMKKTEDKIKGILSAMVADSRCPLLSFSHQTQPMANVDLSDKETPTAVLLCVTDWRLSLKSHRRREVCDVLVSFLVRQQDVGFDGSQNSAKVGDMEDVAVDFVRRIEELQGYRIKGEEVVCKTIFNKYDTNTTGVALSFTIEELQGECLDSIEEEQEDETNE